MDAATAYAARVDACTAQNARVATPSGDRWASRASLFRVDPRRTLEANTATVAALVTMHVFVAAAAVASFSRFLPLSDRPAR